MRLCAAAVVMLCCGIASAAQTLDRPVNLITYAAYQMVGSDFGWIDQLEDLEQHYDGAIFYEFQNTGSSSSDYDPGSYFAVQFLENLSHQSGHTSFLCLQYREAAGVSARLQRDVQGGIAPDFETVAYLAELDEPYQSVWFATNSETDNPCLTISDFPAAPSPSSAAPIVRREYPVDLLVDDLDGDDGPDMIIVNQEDDNQDSGGESSGNGTEGRVRVLLASDQTGEIVNFGLFQTPADYAVGTGPVAIALGDLFGTSDEDLVVICDYNSGSDDLMVYEGNSNGSFNTSSTQTDTLDGSPLDVVVGDFGGDSKLDVAVLVDAVGQNPPEIEIWINNGTGFNSKVDHAVATGAVALEVANLDGVGADNDLVVLLGGSVEVRYGDDYSTAETITLGDTLEDIAIGNLDGENYDDIALVDSGTADRIYLLFTDSDGDIMTSHTSVVVPALGVDDSDPNKITLGDIDGDEDLDIVIGNGTTTDVGVFINSDGSFTSEMARVGLAEDFPASEVRVSNIDEDPDGEGDLVVVLRNGSTSSLHFAITEHSERTRVGWNGTSTGGQIVSINTRPDTLAWQEYWAREALGLLRAPRNTNSTDDGLPLHGENPAPYDIDVNQNGITYPDQDANDNLSVVYDWDGIFLDDLNGKLSTYPTYQQDIYATDELLVESFRQFLSGIRPTLASEQVGYTDGSTDTDEHAVVIAGNVGAWWGWTTDSGDPIWQEYAPYLDLMLYENFQSTRLRQDRWEWVIEQMQAAISQGHSVILMYRGLSIDDLGLTDNFNNYIVPRAMFALGSALLVADEYDTYNQLWVACDYDDWEGVNESRTPPYPTSVGITGEVGNNDDNLNPFEWYEHMENLGFPVDDYEVRAADDLYYRQYTGGWVFVNPKNTGDISVTFSDFGAPTTSWNNHLDDPAGTQTTLDPGTAYFIYNN